MIQNPQLNYQATLMEIGLNKKVNTKRILKILIIIIIIQVRKRVGVLNNFVFADMRTSSTFFCGKGRKIDCGTMKIDVVLCPETKKVFHIPRTYPPFYINRSSSLYKITNVSAKCNDECTCNFGKFLILLSYLPVCVSAMSKPQLSKCNALESIRL